MDTKAETESSAPAKVILFGEHAVVHGQPALAAPVSSLRARVTVEKNTPGDGLIIQTQDENLRVDCGEEPLDVESAPIIIENPLVLTACILLDVLRIIPQPDLKLILKSDIPIGSGLGSGAAVSTAIARALIQVSGKTLPDEKLNMLIWNVERLHHGTPSGIDNTVIVYEKPVFFVRKKPRNQIDRLEIKNPFTLLIADTGISSPTKIAVGDVWKLVEAGSDRINAIFDRIGAIAHRARQLIEDKEKTQTPLQILGKLMNDNHRLLTELTVSCPELDTLCRTALEQGAMGAKLSGGGRGGNMIALVSDEKADVVKKALQKAGAVRVIQTTVG